MGVAFPGESIEYRTARDRLLDQLDGVAEHATQHLNLAVVAKAPLPRILTFARERGWRRLRLFSSAANSYNRLQHDARAAPRPAQRKQRLVRFKAVGEGEDFVADVQFDAAGLVVDCRESILDRGERS